MLCDGLLACDFTFRALDDDGVSTRFDALFAYGDVESGTCYIVYADVEPDEDGEVGTYASIVCDEAELEHAVRLAEGGCTPKKPPRISLAAIEDPAAWDLIARVFDEVDAEEGDEARP